MQKILIEEVMEKKNTDIIMLFKVFSDLTRVKIIKVLLQKNSYVEELAHLTGLTPATISFHLKKMERANIVKASKEQYYVNYSIDKKLFEKTLGSFFEKTDVDESIEIDKYKNKVIKSFFKYGKLKQIPVQRKKRRIVLEHILKEFKKEKEYLEKEVNLIIADFHDDFCTLRREMICEKLMERKKGVYRVL